ncbi:MAG: hypothetical protein V2I33_06180 [Kangiellaceae bacterium]|jgi:hypothetical protein|nr:hypothetical protein [Kangiellaceae bacterium]
MIKNLAMLSSIAFLSFASQANDTSKCQAIKEADKRLSCYDTLFPPTVAIDAKKIDLSKKTDEAKKRNTDIFGLEGRIAQVTPDKITSIAVGNFKEWKKKMKITLKNGQVWKVTSGKLYHRAKNPKVTLSKGALGSHFLSIEGVTKRLKVKRVK